MTSSRSALYLSRRFDGPHRGLLRTILGCDEEAVAPSDQNKKALPQNLWVQERKNKRLLREKIAS